jgi:hypothetical protein
MIIRNLFLGVALGSIALGSACSGDNEVDRLLDCHQICDRYSDCFDADYAVSTCRSRCENDADADAQFENRVDACENCIDGLSCAEGAFSCATECGGIVP